MRTALVVGINWYQYVSPLNGCVRDAEAVAALLARHEDETRNFDVHLLTSERSTEPVPRVLLKDTVRRLFATEAEIALFYFAGHGYLEATGGYLQATDSRHGDDGLALDDILTLANQSPARNKLVILDSCHSGVAGAVHGLPARSELCEGLTVLTASTAQQTADETRSGGVFTSLLVHALSGASANLMGDVTPGSVYAHIDQSLGAWAQRPLFKTNVKSFVSLRRTTPPIPLADLRQLPSLFPEPGYLFALDPSFEPTSANPEPDHTSKFAVLQKYNRVGLLVPHEATHMYYAAIESKGCKLTALGEHFWRLAVTGRI